ncbi:hypothetical protein SeLEV6574_g05226 [Synchytrium endobioticum]|uniref:Alpha/beta hydrolase fold-3 domain-containing protein n=1 Tax=Synchytrium endobioticum TaxID=286115 RepID=A0A507CVD8_9FUNG|nr:hypothetical protein SeLEV6574_g05226 [Synchytrium endobioticum]
MAGDLVDGVTDTGKFRRPTWTRAYHFQINMIRRLLASQKDNLLLAQRGTRTFTAPIPYKRAWTRQINLPRREDLLLEDMSKDDATGVIPAEWIQDSSGTPKEKPAERVVLYVHGGAYVLCSPRTHRPMTWRVSKFSDARVLAIDYRLAPQHLYPLALHDVLSAYSYLLSPPNDDPLAFKYKPEQIVFMGDSAGGGLVFAAIMYIRDHPDEFALPAGLAGIAPWLDLTHMMPSFVNNGIWDYVPDATQDPRFTSTERRFPYVKDNSYLNNPLVSPLYAKAVPGRQLCPTLMQVGEVERLRDENIYFAMHRFADSPVRLEIYQDMVHVYHMFMRATTVVGQSYGRLGAFVREVTDAAKSNTKFHVGKDRCVLIRNVRPFPVEGLPDPMTYVLEGLEKEGKRVEDIDRLLDAGEVKRDVPDPLPAIPPSTSMSIKYFWKYLTSLSVVKEKLGSVDSKQFLEVTGDAAPKGVPGGLKGVGGKGRKGRTYVDILGCFYTEIIRCVELGHPSRPCNFAPLIQKLKRIFHDGGTVFVIDGAPTSAKSETSMMRHREWGKVVDELDKVAASMKQAADDGRKRMPKSFYQKLDRLTRRSFLVNDDVKTGLAAALEAEFKVEKAPGEADVYIGRVATDLDIVASGDSVTSKKNSTDATRAIASLSQRCGGYRTIHVGHLPEVIYVSTRRRSLPDASMMLSAS